MPFPFDVHAMIYSTDAPTLEKLLHDALAAKRVNLVNQRKEFFRVTIDEICAAHAKLARSHAVARETKVEITRLAEAEEFRQSEAARRA